MTKSLPHIPQSVTLKFDELLNSDFKLFQASDTHRLGCRLLDLVLYALKKENRVKVLITDSHVFEAFVYRAREIGLNPKTHAPKSIYLDWSEAIYPSQKVLTLDKVYQELGRSELGPTLLQLIVTHDLPKAIRTQASLVNSPLSIDVLNLVKAAQQLYNPLLNIAALEQLLVKKDLNLDILSKELLDLSKIVNKIHDALNAVDENSLDSVSLRRMNHSSLNPVVIQLYDVCNELNTVTASLTQLNCELAKNPLNAAVLVTYLESQVGFWGHFCYLLTNTQLTQWLGVLQNLPWDVAESIWNLAKSKIQTPWSDVILRQRASQDYNLGEFISTPIKFQDSQHLLRVLIGNVREKIEIVLDESLLSREDVTLTILPDAFQNTVVNPLFYEVVSTVDDLPLCSRLNTGSKLNDSQLLLNANLISKLIARRISKLEIFLNKSNIIISTLQRNAEVNEYFSRSNYQKMKLKVIEEDLVECLIDSNRKVGIIVLGSLLALDDLNDWVYQMQVLEVIKATGVDIIDIPLQINNGKAITLPTLITTQLQEYVGD